MSNVSSNRAADQGADGGEKRQLMKLAPMNNVSLNRAADHRPDSGE